MCAYGFGRSSTAPSTLVWAIGVLIYSGCPGVYGLPAHWVSRLAGTRNHDGFRGNNEWVAAAGGISGLGRTDFRHKEACTITGTKGKKLFSDWPAEQRWTACSFCCCFISWGVSLAHTHTHTHTYTHTWHEGAHDEGKRCNRNEKCPPGPGTKEHAAVRRRFKGRVHGVRCRLGGSCSRECSLVGQHIITPETRGRSSDAMHISLEYLPTQ